MRIDLYTKTILTLIALLLGVVALKPIIQPQPVSAQASLAGVQFSGSVGGFWLFDTKTGDVWAYEKQGSNTAVTHVGRVPEIGHFLN
jgi:hypothetical protein